MDAIRCPLQLNLDIHDLLQLPGLSVRGMSASRLCLKFTKSQQQIRDAIIVCMEITIAGV